MTSGMLRCPLISLVVLLVTLPVLLTAPPAQAAFAPTVIRDAAGAPIDREVDLAMLRAALERRLVQQRLVDLGLDPGEASARLDALSDEELHAAADQMRALVPGGDAGLGIVIGLLVIVVLVIVILKLMKKEIIIR